MDKEFLKENISMEDLLQSYSIDLNCRNKCLCPFHSEKTPSASVKNNLFHCFGCHVSFDVIGFVMKYEKVDFQKALEVLAARFGYSDKELTKEEKIKYAKLKKENEIKKSNVLKKQVKEEKLLKSMIAFDKKINDSKKYGVEFFKLKSKLLNLKRKIIFKSGAFAYMEEAENSNVLLYDLFYMLPKEKQEILINEVR